MEFNIVITGFKETLKRLNKIRDYSPVAANNIMHEMGRRTKIYAQNNIHSATGELKDSITYKRTGDKFVTVTVAAMHGTPVEEGFTMKSMLPIYSRTVAWAQLRGIKDIGYMAKSMKGKSVPGQHYMGKAVDRVGKESNSIITAEMKKLFY